MRLFDSSTGERFLNDLQRNHIHLNAARVQRTVQMIIQTAMEIEVTMMTAAPRYERQSTRRVYRNGYRESLWQIGMEKIPLRIPRVRRGTYHPTFLTSSKRWHDILTFARLTLLQGTTLEQCEDLLQRLGIASRATDMLHQMVDALRHEHEQQSRAVFSDRWQRIILDMWIPTEDYPRNQQVVVTAVGEDKNGGKELLTQKLIEDNNYEAFAAFIWQLEQRNIHRIPYDVVQPHRILREVVRRNSRQPQMRQSLPIMSLFNAA